MAQFLRWYTEEGAYKDKTFISFYQVQIDLSSDGPDCYRVASLHQRKRIFASGMEHIGWVRWNRVGRGTTTFKRPEAI